MAEHNTGQWEALRGSIVDTPELKEQYARTKAAVIQTRELLQQIDSERELAGLSKAALADRIGVDPSVVRRLFSAESSNPTLHTVLELAGALGMQISFPHRAAAHGLAGEQFAQFRARDERPFSRKCPGSLGPSSSFSARRPTTLSKVVRLGTFSPQPPRKSRPSSLPSSTLSPRPLLLSSLGAACGRRCVGKWQASMRPALAGLTDVCIVCFVFSSSRHQAFRDRLLSSSLAVRNQ